MTARILKSSLAGFADFAATAATHAVEMKNWRAHMARVQQDEAAGVTGIDRHWPHPRPSAHPLVEAAVNENDEMDFEIVDDGPTPDQVLRARKNELLGEVYRLEQIAIAAIVPPGKRRFLNLRESEIVSDHAERLRTHNDGILKAAASAMGLRKEPEMSEADAAYLNEQMQRRQKIAAVEAAAAQAMHDIEDLTAETIGAWQIPDFPT